MILKTLGHSSFALVCALTFSVIGAETASAAGKIYDTSLAEKPCAILTTDQVATTLNIAPDKLEQSGPEVPFCIYEMDDDGKTVEVTLVVSAFDTDKAAAKSFHELTQDRTAEEITQMLQELGIDADEDESDSIASITKPETTGVQFESIKGIAEQARFQTNEGALHLLQGNLYLVLMAYYGPVMPVPENIAYTDFAALEKASSAWVQDTMDVRKEQTTALAKAALEAL
ncbi:MAG TPA: hypothetical protein GX719_11295 [Gammaproteobacteria bacterium]|nr:hypothetical protein [Gammaproteobacteria bacterium]